MMEFNTVNMLPTLYQGKEITGTDVDAIMQSELYQELAFQNQLTADEEAGLKDYLLNLDPEDSFNPGDYEVPDYGPITYEDRRKVMGGYSDLAGTPDGLAGPATATLKFYILYDS